MSTLYTSFVSNERLQRNVVLWFGISCVTILCHVNFSTSNPSVFPLDQTHIIALRFQHGDQQSLDGKKPKANDDVITTAEENPIQFNILENDVISVSDDSSATETTIDPTSVDLIPETAPLDKTLNLPSGSYAVSLAGDLNFIPAVNFFGSSRIAYTVNNSEGERSNVAHVTINVSNTNDPPLITGQSPNPLTTNEESEIVIQPANLLVTDPDSNYPENFSITVEDGLNYTVSGNAITPVINYSGPLLVPVSVNDGSASSLPYVLNVSVSAVNDPPVITGQTPSPIVATEDQAFTIELSNLTVTDPDDSYPTGFTLQITDGSDYDVVGNTITPAPNFYGTLSIPVVVNDGDVNSNTYNVQVSVTNVNDAPQITGQTPNPLTTSEDQSLTIAFSNLTVVDSDNSYPTGFTMTLSAGDNYSINGLTVIPAADFSGMLSVPVIVNDGQANSNQFSIAVNVTNANDPPVITGQSVLTTNEDNSITITLSHLTVTDTDDTFPTDFTLSLYSGSNYTLSGSTVIPAPNFSGTLTVPATVNDGETNSNTFALTITVSPVNDVPIITSQTNLTTPENTPLQLTTGNFTVTDVDNAYPTGFSILVLPGSDYTVSGTTITPAQGFSGTLNVGVQVTDGAATSEVFNASIAVNAVNDPPVITASQTLTVLEDNSITPALSDLTVVDPDNIYPNGFTLTVLAGTNYTVSGSTVIPNANFTGSLSVSVLVNDGNANSNTFSLPVNVTPVNDAPQITGQQTLSVAEDQSFTLMLEQLIVNDVDNTYPTGFALTSFPGTNYTLNGNTVTPAANFQGVISVPVQVSDGTATSNIFQLQISVTDVNDTPVITGQTPLSTTEDTPVAITLANLTVLDPDNTYPVGFTLTISPGTNYTVAGNIITPAQDFNGTLNVTVAVNDGSTTSAPFAFQIQVGDANDPPLITGQTSLATSEETPITLSLSNLNVTDPDNAYPAGFSIQVSAGANYTFENATITPASNFVGTLTVPVRVNDGINYSPTFNLTVVVNPLNDAPSFDAIANQSVQENGSPAVVTITGISKGPGEADQQLTFTAVSSNASVIPNPSITYTGGTTAQLTYSLAANANGIVTITVTATDNGLSTSPNKNSYSSTFQINVLEVNNAPTLDNILNVTMQEDAALQSISLTGITAGAGENQTLAISFTTDKPSLFETFTVAYSSPQNTATLQIKPAANSYGVATASVKITDNGSNTSPSVNSITKNFTITIQPVNDAPVFTSTPIAIAAVGESYEYIVTFTDIETPNLPVIANSKPAWVTLTLVSAGKFRLAGIPPAVAQGESIVDLRINDNDKNASQQFTLVVNNRPIAKPVTLTLGEDAQYTFNAEKFSTAYSDPDQHSLKAILVTQLPPNGKLMLSGSDVKANDTIEVAGLSQLTYQPTLNFDDTDVFFWKAFDGYHFSAAQASVTIVIQPANDPPVILLSQDTLQFEVNGEPAIVSEILEIQDPDSDSLTRAEIVFTENFDLQFDQLIVKASGNIKGYYEPDFGRIVLTGLAPISDYEAVIGQIQYNHLNTLDPVLRRKKLTYTASDGIATGEPTDRLIDLKYTFIELEIPSGFTPNGDQSNDVWIISRPGGLEQLQGATIRVLNKRGVVVFETTGFDKPWDGTLNGMPLPADSYFFTIDLNLRSKKTYKGVITILR